MNNSLFFNLFIGICIVAGGISIFIDGDFRGTPIPKPTAILLITLGVFDIIYHIYKYRGGRK
jgi:hypothetical protein